MSAVESETVRMLEAIDMSPTWIPASAAAVASPQFAGEIFTEIAEWMAGVESPVTSPGSLIGDEISDDIDKTRGDW